MAIFQSEIAETLKKLANKTFATQEERDELLARVEAADGLRARDVVWMLFRPDRAMRDSGARTLGRIRDAAETVETAKLRKEAMAAIDAQPSLVLRGLMTMPPFDDLEAAKRIFETLASLRALHGGAPRLPELSMGMSQDYEIAVEEGATMVRVGTAIFGVRPAPVAT